MIVNSCYFSVVVFVRFLSLEFASVRLCIVFLWVQLNSFGGSFPSSTFCMARFVDRYCWNLFFIYYLVSHSLVIEGFSGYSSLGLPLWSFSVCNISVQNLLTSIVSIDKSSLYVCLFPLQLVILFLFLHVLCFDYYMARELVRKSMNAPLCLFSCVYLCVCDHLYAYVNEGEMSTSCVISEMPLRQSFSLGSRVHLLT